MCCEGDGGNREVGRVDRRQRQMGISGSISITGVGSRAVVQCGAVIIIVLSLIAKVGALFAMMPGAMTSGLYCALFGLIVAVGLSNLQ